ncbi:MAG: Transcriptional regulator, MarR family [Aeromicrobium sp.]|nr:Transcriptional regulator, MarR family [Aeromicrobium sp.]
MRYTYMVDDELYALDDLLVRLRVAQMRPAWRRRVLESATRDVTFSDLRVLRTVERRAAHDLETSIGDVAEDVGIEHSTASRAVTSAERRGLVERTVSSTDQRRTRLRLTPGGAEALTEMSERRRGLVAETVVDWPPDQLRQLVGLLDQLAADFDGWQE